MIARGVSNEGDQPNVLMLNFDNARKLVQKELGSEHKLLGMHGLTILQRDYEIIVAIS